MSDRITGTRAIRRDGRLESIEFMRCVLAIVSGPETGKHVTIESSLIRIGSSPGCNLVISDQTVSRVHCEIEVGERGFLLRDLESLNGVFVGRVQVKEVYLEPGTEFSVGGTRVELRTSDERMEIRLSPNEKFGDVLGRSAKMREIFYLLEKMASKDSTILLTGETGTGKEVFARSIHDESSRRGAPFITIDCGSLPENLIEEELFGHVKGAFTGATSDRMGAFEEARGGTVFLDEIGELPLAQQVKLLRVLESREIKRVGEATSRPVEVRILAATNRVLADEVEQGTFRKDLYYRLSVLELRIPSLRERPDDVPLLAEHFLEAMAKRSGKPRQKITLDGLAALSGYPWPGNVRELRNVLEKAVTLDDAAELDASAIAVGSLRNHPDPASGKGAFVIDATVPYDVAHDRFEREYLMELLRANEMNVSKAARAGGIHRQSIHRLLRKHGIKLQEYR